MERSLMTQLEQFVSATEMLRQDHRKVKRLFRDFQDAKMAAKRALAEKIFGELKVHSAVEEEVFYPAVRKLGGENEIDQAYQDHLEVELLINELETLPAGGAFNAGFEQLIEAVTKHIEEEESTLLPAAENGGMDLASVGRDMALVKYRELAKSTAKKAATPLGLGALALVGAAAALGWFLFKGEEAGS